MIAAALDALAFSELRGRRAADPLPEAAAGGFAVRLVEVVEQRRNPHRHPRGPELILVLEGSGEHWQDGERRRLSERELVLVPTGVPHVSLANPGSRLLLYCVFCDPDPAASMEELEGEIAIGS